MRGVSAPGIRRRDPTFTTQEVRRTSPGEWGVGSTFDTTAEYRGKPGEHTYRVTAFERPTRMAVQGRWGSAPVDAALELSPTGGKTFVRETIELHPPSRWWWVPATGWPLVGPSTIPAGARG